MKKYRIIEFDPRTNNTVAKEEFTEFKKAVSEIGQYIIDDPECFYSIEDVEESIMDRVKTYKDACEVLGIHKYENVDQYLDFGYYDNDGKERIFSMPKHIKAVLKLETITTALNEGWKSGWRRAGGNDKKFYVYYDSNDETLHVDWCCNESMSDNHLYFKSEELADYAAKQFEDLYKELLIL